MSVRSNYPLNIAIMLFAPLFLGACTGVSRSAHLQEQRLEQLVAGMDQCLSSQTQAAEQLQRQELQLKQQQQQLTALGAAVESATRAASSEALPVDAAANVCVLETAAPDAQDASSKLMVGQLEQVWLQNLQLALPARIDTGAETASLDARNIELFERNGRRWVRFEILHPKTGEPLPVERKLKRMVAIVQSNTPDSERRAVIKMGITIGDISQTAEFTLSDRSHLDYQVLVGRNILKDFMVVDVSRENIAPLAMPEEPQSAQVSQ